MRRKNDGFLFLLSWLPWWVSAAIALIGYVAITHVLPSLFIDFPVMGPIIHQALQNHSQSFGIIFAVIFLIPAGLSFFNRARKKQLLDRQKDIESIRSLSWREFEELVAEAFRREGYTVTENTYAGADGGVDIRLRREGKSYLVQCKNWRKQKVGVAIVREMYGVMVSEAAQKVFIVCSGRFTVEAEQFAKGKPIILVDGDALTAMVGRVRRGNAEQGQQERLAEEIRELHGAEAPESQPAGSMSTRLKSRCPRCGGDLVVRTTRKGKDVGRQFLGCETFPRCRFTTDLPGP